MKKKKVSAGSCYSSAKSDFKPGSFISVNRFNLEERRIVLTDTSLFEKTELALLVTGTIHHCLSYKSWKRHNAYSDNNGPQFN